MFGIVAETEARCAELIRCLNEKGIGTRPFFWCMHEQPLFMEKGLFKKEHYPVAEKLARNGFYIPSGLGLKDEELEVAVTTIAAIG